MSSNSNVNLEWCIRSLQTLYKPWDFSQPSPMDESSLCTSESDPGSDLYNNEIMCNNIVKYTSFIFYPSLSPLLKPAIVNQWAAEAVLQ